MQVVVDGVLTHYLLVDPGHKNTLLILHGWGQSAVSWQKIMAGLPKDNTYIALDLPSFGATRSLPGKSNVSDYSHFIKKFIAKLDLKNVILLGHSFGGQIAVDLSLHYPKLIKHLILLSPAVIRNTRLGLKSKLNKTGKPLIKLLPLSIQDKILQKVASKNYFQSSPEQRSLLNRILYQDYSDKIKEIHVPTSVIWGSEDNEIPNKGKFLAENIPDSKLFVLYGADHSPHLNSPRKLLSVLTEILSQNA